MQAAALSVERAWQALRAVPDPEIPVLSVVDLGIVRGVAAEGDAVAVTVTPTYSGCPATEAIARAIVDALKDAGAAEVRVITQLAPAWTTDWIAPAARDRLRAYGIAPPMARAAAHSFTDATDPADAARADGVPARVQPLRFLKPAAIDCPRCGSADTERLSQFGATACKALYRCRACREPFEYFKPL